MSGKEATQEREMKQGMVIKFAEMDPKFKYEVSKLPGAEKLVLCFQCGTCTADCPVARFSEFYRPRKIVRMMQLGLKDRLLSSDFIWLCTTCFACVDHCPQDVETAGIVRALRNLAVKEGNMPPIYRELASTILKTGYAYRITALRLRRREDQGLPPLPKANLESVKKLFDITGFSKIVEKGG